jgi:hypothetical protein
MSSQVLVTLPDTVLKSATSVAHRSGRLVEDVLVDAITEALGPAELHEENPLDQWTNSEVLTNACSMMDPGQDARLGELLERQQQSALSPSDTAELTALVRVYERGLLRKADAIHEAVRRGLMEPPTP